jgi:hypothetical protein
LKLLPTRVTRGSCPPRGQLFYVLRRSERLNATTQAMTASPANSKGQPRRTAWLTG